MNIIELNNEINVDISANDDVSILLNAVLKSLGCFISEERYLIHPLPNLFLNFLYNGSFLTFSNKNNNNTLTGVRYAPLDV